MAYILRKWDLTMEQSMPRRGAREDHSGCWECCPQNSCC